MKNTRRIVSIAFVALTVSVGLPSPGSGASRAASLTPCLHPTYDRCEAWVSAPYDGPAKAIDRVGNMLESANSMAITPDGTVLFTAGSTDRVGPYYSRGPIAVLGFHAATGDRLWAARYEGPSQRPFANVGSVIASDSAVFVTGYTHSPTDATGMTLAYDARTGSPLWEAEFPGVALASAISPDGSLLFVVGEQRVDVGDGGSEARARTVAYDAATGEPIWTRSLADPGSGPLAGWRVGAAPDQVTVLAARVDQDGYTDGLVLATYRATGLEAGDLISKIAVPIVPGNAPAGLALNADGSRAFVVQDRHASEGEGAFTAGFDTVTGTLLWTAFYAGDGVESFAVPWFFNPIGLSPNGDTVYVAAQVGSNWTRTEGVATVAYRARDGERLWSAVEETVSPVRCVASCGPILSVNPKTGQIVVAGASLVGNRQQAATWSYGPNGTLQWKRRAGTLPAGASIPVGYATESAWTSIVHSPDGARVFVGGSAWAIVNDPESSEDVVVAAFDTAVS